MENNALQPITVTVTVNAPMEKVWQYFNTPEHVMNWNNASDDWHTPYAESDFRVGGKSKATMAARDGSFSFDFEYTYTKIDEHRGIDYTMGDGRKASLQFEQTEAGVLITETFDPESTNPIEMQRGGWQAILDNFKKYTEAN